MIENLSGVPLPIRRGPNDPLPRRLRDTFRDWTQAVIDGFGFLTVASLMVCLASTGAIEFRFGPWLDAGLRYEERLRLETFNAPAAENQTPYCELIDGKPTLVWRTESGEFQPQGAER